MKRVLILCTGNSCRSQMAEVLWRELALGTWQAFSAGSAPTGEVHPYAMLALERNGYSSMGLRSKSVCEFKDQEFDLVVTVCDNAQEACPVFPGSLSVHWPFPDPAEAEGSADEQLAQFAQVCQDIAVRIGDYFAEEEKADRIDFGQQLAQRLDHLPGVDAESKSRYGAFVHALSAEVASGSYDWKGLPGMIAQHFESQGWAWNGIYARAGESSEHCHQLQLVAAAGPPVCGNLQRSGGWGKSGMCFDAVTGSQAIVANGLAEWPGYHSCDAQSGLKTVAGMVLPIRSRAGRIIAVWDLDSTEALSAADALFLQAVIECLATACPPSLSCFI